MSITLRLLKESCIPVVVGLRPYNNTGTFLQDYNYTIGPDGYHTQWSSLTPRVQDIEGKKGLAPFLDILGHWISRFSFEMGPLDSRRLFQVSSTDQVETHIIKNYISTRKYRDILDVQPTNLLAELRGLANPVDGIRYRRDKLTTHLNGTGFIGPKVPFPRSPSYKDLEFGRLEVAKYDLDNIDDGVLFGYTGYSNVGGLFDADFVTSASFTWHPGLYAGIQTLKMWKESRPHLWFYSDTSIHEFVVNSLNFRLTDQTLDIDYDYTVNTTQLTIFPSESKYWSSSWSSHFSIVLNPNGSQILLEVGGNRLPAGFDAHVFWDYKLKSGYHESGSSITDNYRKTFFHGFSGVALERAVPIIYVMHKTFIPTYPVDPVKVVQEEVHKHGMHWLGRYNDLVASNYFSFTNAIKTVLSDLDTNLLESIPEITELPELIPDVLSLLTALAYAKKLDPRGLAKFGDFIAENTLRYSFGIAPDIKLIQELNSKGSSLRRYFEGDFHPTQETFYGRMSYSFQKNETPYDGARLTTITAVDAEFLETFFTKKLLRAYGLRVLPNLRNVWETLPFSFVADWFTRMAERLGGLDSYSLSFAFAIKGLCHSYTVTTPTSSSARLEKWFDTSNSEFRFYKRDITKVIPTIPVGLTEIDYLAVLGSPNLGIFGSLIYVLTR